MTGRHRHTPLHASWVNQIEIWFGLLQRRILRSEPWGSTAWTAMHAMTIQSAPCWNRQ